MNKIIQDHGYCHAGRFALSADATQPHPPRMLRQTDPDHRSIYSRDGIITHSPQSDHASMKGDSSSRLLELGKENFAAQNYGLSERYFREAVANRSDNVSAWAGLAASYDQLGNFEKADRAYKALVESQG